MASVGRPTFFDGVRAYLRAHAWGNTTLADLLAALETASGRELAGWSERWLRTCGVSTLRVADGPTGPQTTVLQTSTVLREHRIGIGRYDRSDDALVLRSRDEVEVVDVEGHELTHPDATRVEELQNREVAHVQWVVVVRGQRGHVEQVARLVLSQHAGQGRVAPWRDQA